MKDSPESLGRGDAALGRGRESPIEIMERSVSEGSPAGFGELQSSLARYDNCGGEMRIRYARRYGYGVPCREVLDLIARYGPLLELGAGNGFWSFWLRRKGCDVIATDPKEGGMHNRNNWLSDLVEVGAVEALGMYPGRNVLMVWPHYHSTWPSDVVQRMKPGQVLCYVGERPFGCCAPLTFFSSLKRNGFGMLHRRRTPSWDKVTDYLTVYRKGEASSSRDAPCRWY